MAKSETIDKHISLKLTQLFMKCIGMWYPENSWDITISNFIIIYIIIATTVALIVMSIDFYHVKDDLRAVAINIPCTLSVVQELYKILRFANRIVDVRYFNAFTVKTFWKFEYDATDLSILRKCNKICILSCGTFFFFILTIDMHHITIPILEYENNKTRILPFKLYFGFNEISPWYEMFYVMEVGCVFGVTIVTTAFILHLFTMTIYGAVDQSDSYENLKNCIKQHQMLIKYINMLSELYSPITCVYAVGAIGTICLTGFQLVSGVNNNFHRNALSFEFFLATVIMLFMACYCCQKIMNESLAVCEAVYNIPNYQKTYNQSLLFMMMRSRKPCAIQCFSTPMSIEIFTAVVNKSMSFFAVLRQMLEDTQ